MDDQENSSNDKPKEPDATEEKNRDEAQTGTMYVGAFPPEVIAQVRQGSTQNRGQSKRGGAFAVVSIIATVVPILVWLYCLAVSGGSMDEGGAGAVWWSLIIYYWTLGLPLLVAAIICGVLGLKSSLGWLAAISLSLKVVTILAIMIILVIL